MRQLLVLFFVILVYIVNKGIPQNFVIKKRYRRVTNSFTQGLFFLDNDTLIESSGLYSRSYIHKLTKNDFSERIKVPNLATDFAEGACLFNNTIIEITWHERNIYIYDTNLNLIKKETLPHEIREVWGLTSDGSNLIVSEGSSTIYFIDPKTFQIIKKIEVKTRDGKTIYYLNELEYARGLIFANVYLTPYIVAFDKEGRVIKLYNMEELVKLE